MRIYVGRTSLPSTLYFWTSISQEQDTVQRYCEEDLQEIFGSFILVVFFALLVGLAAVPFCVKVGSGGSAHMCSTAGFLIFNWIQGLKLGQIFSGSRFELSSGSNMFRRSTRRPGERVLSSPMQLSVDIHPHPELWVRGVCGRQIPGCGQHDLQAVSTGSNSSF